MTEQNIMIMTGIALLLVLVILVTLLVKCVISIIEKIPRKSPNRIYVKNSRYHTERSRGYTIRIIKPYGHQRDT
ncbi:MAG: hypothetical protein HDQ88_09305 [Clostridia bacterium]|nr:hypothetical protein [Clostridia bacterium]